MYLGSAYLKNRIETVAKKADLLTGHAVVFEEFIALPFFGQIILRFNLNKEGFTEGDVDRYKRMLRIAAGEEFLTDFMGSVYQKAGMNFSLLEGRLKELNKQGALRRRNQTLRTCRGDTIRCSHTFESRRY